MKKFLSIVAILLLIVMLVGCKLNPNSTPPNTDTTNPSDQNPPDINDPNDVTPPDVDDPGIVTPPDVDDPDDPVDPPVVTPPDVDDPVDPPVVTPPDDDPPKEEPFEDYGLPVINVYLSKLDIKEDGLYTSMEEVGAYLYLYHKLPKNFVTKSIFEKKEVTSANKLSTGGDTFGNRERLLPLGKSYRECDIDYHGGSRNAKRIVYSVTDWTIFYTNDHYASFSILRFFE